MRPIVFAFVVTVAILMAAASNQISDVDIDARGLAYASDRVGTVRFILEYRRPNE